MGQLGVELSGLQGRLDPAALAKRDVKLRLTAGRARLSDEGLRWLMPPGAGFKVDRIERGHLFIEVKRQVLLLGQVRALVEFRPFAANGRIRLEPKGLKAAGLTLPASVVNQLLGMVRDQLVGKPGVHLAPGNVLEIDLGEILWKVANLEIPPLKSLHAGDGIAELEF